MNIKKGSLKVLMTLIASLGLAKAENLYFVNNNSMQDTYLLDNVRKITFPNNEISLHSKLGYEKKYSISEVKYMSFVDYEDGGQITSSKLASSFVVNHNFTANSLEINLDISRAGFSTIQIFNVSGKSEILKSNKLSEGQNILSINLSDLARGVYYCRIQVGNQVQSFNILKGK